MMSITKFCFCQSFLFCHARQNHSTTDLHPYHLFLPILDLHWEGIIQYVLLSIWFL
jgi:hypothetical protein